MRDMEGPQDPESSVERVEELREVEKDEAEGGDDAVEIKDDGEKRLKKAQEKQDGSEAVAGASEVRGWEAPVGCRVQLGERECGGEPDLEMPLQEFERMRMGKTNII